MNTSKPRVLLALITITIGFIALAPLAQAANIYKITNQSGEDLGTLLVNLDDQTSINVDVHNDGEFPVNVGAASVVSVTINQTTVDIGQTEDVALTSGAVVTADAQTNFIVIIDPDED